MTTYRDQSYDLAVQYDAHGFELTDETKVRFEEDLDRLATILRRGPAATLHVEIVRHARRDDFHVKAGLKIARVRTFFTGDRDRLVSPAFKRCVHKLIRKVERFRDQVEGRRVSAADRGPRVTAAMEPSWNAMTRAVSRGDYAAFRDAVSVYEDALGQRVGRAVERFPAAAAVLGDGILLSEVVEDVFLHAFEELSVSGPVRGEMGGVAGGVDRAGGEGAAGGSGDGEGERGVRAGDAVMGWTD